MLEKALILQKQIEADLEAIHAMYGRLSQPPAAMTTDENAQIVTAYHLHNLYNAFENIFLQIARIFENHLDEPDRWHSHLLQRMTLDLTPIRPAVIDTSAYDALDELRRFRHLFRSAYRIQFDPDRLQLVWQKAMHLRDLYPTQLDNFIHYLQTLT